MNTTDQGKGKSQGPERTGSTSPLISILLCGHSRQSLAECLGSIFDQNDATNFEVVVCDDGSADGAWNVADQYCRKHAGKVTISRNRTSMGKRANRRKGMQMCKGHYCVELESDSLFDAEYVSRTVKHLEADDLAEHAFISRLRRANVFMPPHNPVRRISMQDRKRKPLVSICVYNFNYGRYLRQCLDSVFAQTWANIEVCFSDNASTDDSWDIAMEFAAKYPDRISLTRNRINYGPNVNLWNCLLNMNGKYMLKLCSDDAIQPEFIERCVNALEEYPDAAFAMVHREIMDEAGNLTSEPPFYEHSCLIPGNEQAAVYMMSSVNPSVSQILYKLEKTQGKRMAGNLNDRWFGDRIMDFHICCDSPVVYIKEPLLLNRIHGQSESAGLNGNLLQCMGEFVLLHQLSDIAGNYPNMQQARNRLQPALEKVGHLCLRYCLRCLSAGDETGALRYFHLSSAITPTVQQAELYARLSAYWSKPPSIRRDILPELLSDSSDAIRRVVSYPVPPGSIMLNLIHEPPVTDSLQSYLHAARNGDRLDPATFVNFCRKFNNVIVWGAGNLGTAVGKKLREIGVNQACYWDTQADRIGSRNGLQVIAPFSGGFDRETTLVLFCIGNVVVGPNIQRQLGAHGWRHVVHGNDLLQALLCPLGNDKPADARICNSFDICSVCSCERLHNIVRAEVSRNQGVAPQYQLSFDRVHFITNNVCNLKCTHCFLYINSYPKARKQNVATKQILQDINVVLRAIHSLGVVNIFGGEPFLHKDITRIVQGVLAHNNFGAVIVNTNGIEPIDPEQMVPLQDPRVRLAFSNYLDVLDEKRVAAFHRNVESARAAGVNAKYQNSLPTWNISSTLEDKHDSDETKRQKKLNCGVRYLYVFDGKLFPCSFTLSINDLGVADYPSDYVLLDPAKDSGVLREEIRQMLDRPYYGACGHCESFGSPALASSAAEQGYDERYALPGAKRRRRVRIPVVSAT